jgi:hypothetical protein
MSTTATERTLESELREHNEAIRRLEGQKAEAIVEAEKLVAAEYEAGRNPQDTQSDSFEKVDKAYLVADEFGEQAAQHREAADKLLRILGGRAETQERQERQRAHDVRGRQAIMETPEYQRLAETKAFQRSGSHIELPGIEIVSAEGVVENIRHGLPLFAATADVGDFIVPTDRRFPPVPIPVRTIRVLDLITMSTTESDKVDYVEEILRTDVAAETALGTAYPEASYAYELREALVRDIGHFTPAHRSNLADGGQLQGLLEGRLQTGVELRLESQIVSRRRHRPEPARDPEHRQHRPRRAQQHRCRADPRSDPPRRHHRAALALPGAGRDRDPPDRVRGGRVREGRLRPVPARAGVAGDVAADLGLPGRRVVGVPERHGARRRLQDRRDRWVRDGVSVRASDSHEDFFTRRMVALLAEMRAAFAAWQPRAFCEADLT